MTHPLIRPIQFGDLRRGFLELLAELSETATGEEGVARASLTLVERGRLRVKTLVALEPCANPAGGPPLIAAPPPERVIGTASYWVEPKFSHGGRGVCHVEDVIVHREHRERGLGRALMAAVEAAAVKEGCYKIILNATGSAERFYGRLGYRGHEAGMRKDLGG